MPKRSNTMLGSVETTLKRDEKAHNSNKVYHRINLSEVTIERGKDVLVEVFKQNGKGWKEIDSFKVTTYESEDGLTLKKSIIENNDLKPGQRLKFDIYEPNRVQSNIDDSTAGSGADVDVINRLKSIEGQINSLKEMLENDD